MIAVCSMILLIETLALAGGTGGLAGPLMLPYTIAYVQKVIRSLQVSCSSVYDCLASRLG